jgi:hypothetical protein
MPSPSSSPAPSRRTFGSGLAIALLALSAMGADASPCGHARRPNPPLNVEPAAERAAEPETDELRRCCRQCAAASSRDPAGVDLRVLPCTKYRSAPPGGPGNEGLDAPCAELLGTKKVLIGTCQEMSAR